MKHVGDTNPHSLMRKISRRHQSPFSYEKNLKETPIPILL